MANTVRNFIAGRMNKTLDERLIPNGEYIDALNIRLGSTEASEIGAVENSKGNTRLTTLAYNGTDISADATCIGAYADGEQETMYWFIHDDNFAPSTATGKIDLIVSYNTTTETITYHVISLDDGGGVNTTLNFSSTYLITGVDLIDDLLFFTDDLNQPRRINVTKNYADPVSLVDAFLPNDILVVKAPPIASPTVLPNTLQGEENFLEDRLISFAYRYKYEDNEYSAVSQFSAPSFTPKQYDLSHDSFLNEGMVNSTNACQITFNSGGPLVVGIDVLFKEMTGNSINVIEKINKADEGYADNTDYTISFANSKIFTVLPSSEILRLYDNVPLLAKAQTVMGNRLMYGNYVDGWDLNTAAGNPTQFNYQTALISEEVGFSELPSTRSSGNYTFGTTVTVPNSILNVDLSSVADNLILGATIDLSLSFTHEGAFSPPTNAPIELSTDRELNFVYTLTQSYASVDDLFNSVDFQEKVGTAANILPVYDATLDTSCDGLTLTDLFNCTITDSLQGGTPTPVYKYASGITAAGQPVSATHTAGTDIISFQFPAMQFVDDVTSVATSFYEYYAVSATNLTYSALGSPTSLHSNRGYEVGMVYMDEFNRSTTALVSSDNTIHVGCINSSDKNHIRVTIPPTQIAPSFASRYKFVIKPDEAGYETVYTSIFFYDPVTATDYFLLRGENAAKIEEGDRLIVKRDVDGPLNSCEYVTVLEKKAQEKGFITVYQSDGTTALTVPQGVYMQIRSSSFNSSLTDDAVIAPLPGVALAYSGTYPVAVIHGLSGPTLPSPATYPIYSVPVGSRIILDFEFSRLGTGSGDNSCERRTYTLNKTYTSSETYTNIIDWWNGDNIGETLDEGVQYVGGDGCEIENIYMPTTADESTPYPWVTPSLCANYYRWYMDTVTNEIRFTASGTRACGEGNNRRSTVAIRIELFRAENTIVFETEPQDALADVWYESSESYPISTTGLHTGNVQTQTATDPAIVDTAFFNCFSFGNGVESYKIRDSISGRALALGNRVTTVSAQDFKRADRFADMTYSGVFNNESNLNKLNEFNLGLFNYKPLEESFGPIEKMVAQDTNILVLQEDKISYVLASKNLISDSTGGGVVASVPEILGTQIARIEEFGISNNPESFAQWGASKYFTDAKRGAVIQLMGNAPNAPLSVVSEAGMRSWFRDMFITNFSSQKLGGFDPYMNEYVLGNNTTALPDTTSCIGCGVNQTYSIPASGLSVCYNLGATVGDVTISWPAPLVTLGGSFSFTATYNGTPQTVSNITAAGSLVVAKNEVSEEQLDIVFSVSGGPATVNFTVGCPVADELTLVLVTLTNNSDSGQRIHNQYRWVDGTWTSPTHSNQVLFTTSTDANVVSQYDTITSSQGGGVIPADGAMVTLVSDKQTTDDFVFSNSTDKFLWLRSSTLYANTEADIALLLAAATSLAPTGSVPTFSADFALTTGSNGDYIYLIWDYATSVPADLCFSATTAADACCVCTCSPSVCTEYTVSNTSSSQVVISYDPCGGGKANVTLGAGKTTVLCSDSTIRRVSGAAEDIVITVTACDCGA
tara:strand:- start:15223 stop:19875 length:4653 start_codon:yes stop_codon:yes gene_type:complete